MNRACALLVLAAGAMAKVSTMTAAEEALADTVVNEIPTHEWSMRAAQMQAPKEQTKPAQIEAWYINSDSATDKATCIEKQLVDAGYAPMRFSALETSQDCIAKGIEEMPKLSEGEKKEAISSWCNHKKLFEALSAAPSESEYFLVLEDTPVIHTGNMRKVLEDFLGRASELPSFSMVQLDPYGGVAQPAGFHRGRAFYRPAEDLQNANAYQGSHAMIVKKTALPHIIQLMNKRKASKLEDLFLQLPSAMALSAGVAVNPMLNKFQEFVQLPSHCQAKATKKVSFIESQAQTAEQDMWSHWPRANDTVKKSIDNTVWWVPNANKWVQGVETEELKMQEPSSSLLEVIQIGAQDENPRRAVCFRDALRARGLGQTRRMQLLEIPSACSAEVEATDYHACLARSGLEDCTITGKLDLDAFESVDWSRRLQIRDHVTKSTCAFQRTLKQVKDGSKPYVLLMNENAVLGKNIKKQIESFIETNPEDVKGKAWQAVQIDPYGREAPIDQGLGAVWTPEKPDSEDAKIADFKYLDDKEAKSRFWGMHAVLLKREAIPSILAEMQVEDGTAIGAVDRIPRHTKGWLAANLGVAYDPHMALLGDECMPSRSEHFKVARSEIPESWTVQKEA